MQNKNIKFHKAKKSFGQNFLKSVLALNTIVEAGKVNKEDVVLEIGPGKGALTSKLLEKAGVVIAIEKDRDLIEILEEKFKEEIEKGRFILINNDILELNVSELSAKENFIKYKIIANIPYNITGAILKKFLTENIQPSLMVLMVQNEVAKRIVANNEGESILSISVKAYGQPKNIMKVQKKYFSPAPKVDSAIILIDNINKDLFTKENINEEKFWSLVHAGFAHKRKVLISNLKNLDKNKDWKEIFSKLNINEKIRAEELKVENWVKLTQSIS
ncbi:MAG: ribosomal RNA small subunit methyltransferase A [Candidatus Pacebacteria bacterium]|nr:ribosomal RNA small subunit methyltransferase A [Candidatus Paceibacterota bacterium]